MSYRSKLLATSALAFAGLAPVAALAQSIGYDSVDGADAGGDEPSSSHSRGHARGGRGGSSLEAYIEAGQIVTSELSPGNETLTYTRVAVGADVTVAGRNNAASASVRYERQIGYGRSVDGDAISGLVRGYAAVVPQVLRVDVGALATRTRTERNGAAVLSPFELGDGVTKVYSAYAGPTLSTHAGEVKVDGHYRIGYTKVESPDAIVATPAQSGADIFDKSTVHDAGIHFGTRPGVGLPIGIGAGAGYYREEISNLDQRIEDFSARGDITVPLSRDFALVGGVGYEDVEISSRDALRDANGIPVIANGRFVTGKSGPRVLAYDVSGLIWDAGVIWKPSRRTAFEAHVGRRYGTTSYYGSLAYAPNDRSSLNVSVYDNIAGFGGQLNRALAGLPAQFTAIRNPLGGDLTGCVSATEKGTCLTGALGSLRSSTFRARGVMASYNLAIGRITAGLAGGYDRRKFIAAPGTVLAAANGVIDENYWADAHLSGPIGQNAGYTVNLYANWFQSGTAFDSDQSAYGATLSYYHNLTNHLAARAAVGIQSVSRPDPFVDQTDGSALVGIRYTF